MTADHHDRELWERYFKPCKNKVTITCIERAYNRSIGLMTLHSTPCYFEFSVLILKLIVKK
jgi:hypothetical protein